MNKDLFSLRMYSRRDGAHHSGAERLVTEADLDQATVELLRRALEHVRGQADEVRLSLDLVPPDTIGSSPLLDVTTVRITNVAQGRRAATDFLQRCGVKPEVASLSMQLLQAGAGENGQNMRGAVLMDAQTGQRLESDPARGVRASRMDLDMTTRQELQHKLALRGLDNPHVQEALVLASKVAATPGIVAELCWSDDPDYTAGYVAGQAIGYVRFPYLKELNDPRGGRVFFVAPGTDPAAVTAFLERRVLLLTALGQFHPDIIWQEGA